MDLLLLWSRTQRPLGQHLAHACSQKLLPGELQHPAAEQLLESEKEESLLPKYYVLHAK